MSDSNRAGRRVKAALRSLTVVVGVIACFAVPTNASAQGVWFDIGDGTATTVSAPSDPASTIYFPPYPFGTFYPPGTLVHSELAMIESGGFARVYWGFFNDGGCGCSGLPSEPITYTLHYDDADLSWQEASTRLYIDDRGDWGEVPGSVLDPTANTLTAIFRVVTSDIKFAIGGPSIVPVESSSWGRIKALYVGP